MVRISKSDYEICEKYGLLYDGKHRKRGLNRAALQNGGLDRTFIRTKNHIYITSGVGGIDKALEYYRRKESMENGNKE